MHSIYLAHLTSQIIPDGQYKYDEIHYPFLTPPVPYVVLGPKIPSKNEIFCHSNTHYIGIHTANDALECQKPSFLFGRSRVKLGAETDYLDWLVRDFRLLLQKIRDSAPNKNEKTHSSVLYLDHPMVCSLSHRMYN